VDTKNDENTADRGSYLGYVMSLLPELIVAFSGGKDSTAMALHLAELGEPFRMLHTATGNELPDVRVHIDRVVRECGCELIDLKAPTLGELIHKQRMIPNWWARWCTRMIKIEPCVKWIASHPRIRLAVGLRADEEGRAGGTYKCEVVYPLRDWGWDIDDVTEYCAEAGYSPPRRTDCAVCFYQTLHEWHVLWSEYPDEYAQGEAWEKLCGHTFRSPQRDSHPAALRELRLEFEAGYAPKARKKRGRMCRICSM